MRLLLLLCAALILANVSILLWPNSVEVANHVYAERADVNAHFISLNKEIETKYFRDNSDSQIAGRVLSENESCYRLGPFMFESNYELAQAVLFNAQLEFDKSTREAQQSLVYRVYIGPFDSQAEIDDARVELKRKNILDHFVRQSDDQGPIISLGIFSTEASADKALVLYGDTIDKVKTQQEELLLPESFWLHFALADTDPTFQQLTVMEWGELAVKLGKYQCV